VENLVYNKLFKCSYYYTKPFRTCSS